jgi:hypothetical protein
MYTGAYFGIKGLFACFFPHFRRYVMFYEAFSAERFLTVWGKQDSGIFQMSFVDFEIFLFGRLRPGHKTLLNRKVRQALSEQSKLGRRWIQQVSSRSKRPRLATIALGPFAETKGSE